MREVDFNKKSLKYITNIPAKHRKQIVKNIILLQSKIKPQDSKKLKGYDYYRVDSGEYRIVYDWDDTTVFILVVGKRNDNEVYKKLKRQ